MKTPGPRHMGQRTVPRDAWVTGRVPCLESEKQGARGTPEVRGAGSEPGFGFGGRVEPQLQYGVRFCARGCLQAER